MKCGAHYFCSNPLGFCFENEPSLKGCVVKLRRVAFLTLMRIWLEDLAKACMQHIYSSEMVHHGGCRVASCGPVASEIGGVMGLLVYTTQHGGLSACFPMVIVSLWCSGISSKDVTTNLTAVFANSSLRMCVCPLILFSFVGRPRLSL